MKHNEIFDTNENEFYDSVNGVARYSIILDDSCRLYKFDKKIGVKLSFYLDRFDGTSDNVEFVEFNMCTDNPDPFLFNEDNLWVELEGEAFDVETNEFKRIGSVVFPIETKATKFIEAKLDPVNLNDEGEVLLRLNYSLFIYKTSVCGFLKKHTKFIKCYLLKDKQIELKTQLVSESDIKGNRFRLNLEP